MSKIVKIQGSECGFPNTCVVCFQPAQSAYKIEKTFSYGQRSITVSLPVPMCSTHYEHAGTKSSAERLCERGGLVGGGVIGLLVTIGLLLYWASGGESISILNVLAAGFVGIGFFLIVWLATVYWLAPVFALPESKAARQAVRLMKYWPGKNILQLEFVNDRTAELFARENEAILMR
jgi:hypothetical protein